MLRMVRRTPALWQPRRGTATTSLRDASLRPKEVACLDLSASEDLQCTNLMCESMRTVSLKDSDLHALPDSLLRLGGVEVMDVSGNGLRDEAVGGAAQLSSLVELRLHGNSLTRPPPWVADPEQTPSLQRVMVDSGCGAAEALRAARPEVTVEAVEEGA